MTETASVRKDYFKIQRIIHTDYSSFNQPLRQLLEYRQEAYKRLDEKNQESEDYRALIDYVETKIKMFLDL